MKINRMNEKQVRDAIGSCVLAGDTQSQHYRRLMSRLADLTENENKPEPQKKKPNFFD